MDGDSLIPQVFLWNN